MPALVAAQDDIQVGGLRADPSTHSCIGVVLPISDGDANYNATAQLEYRLLETANWRQALPLLRVRPDTLSTESPPGNYGLPGPGEEFAGSIFNLEPGASYEVRVTVTDPDGGGTVQATTIDTRPLPLPGPPTPRLVAVASDAALSAALSSAQPGDVISLAPGTYQGPLTVSAAGSKTDPIVLRGSDLDSVTIDAAGKDYGVIVSGSHVYVEHITVRGSTWGVRVTAADGVVIRHSRFTAINRGIDGRGGAHRNYYICDNVLEGVLVWPTTGSNTWGEEGIVVTGQGHVVCHNTISGFGDALGTSQNTLIPNTAIDFYGNDVLWSGDDGIELDYVHRNIRAFRNRVTNSNMGISVQPGWGGPIYMIRNLLVNQRSRPFKFNNEPTGLVVLHNTAIRASGPGLREGAAWRQLGYQTGGHLAWVANFQFINNIVVGTTQPAKFTSDIVLGEIDYNGWFPDGTFQFIDSYTNIADLQANSRFETHGRILDRPLFETPAALGPDYKTFVNPLQLSILAMSNAVDAGARLANVNDGFTGRSPDLGAREVGSTPPIYGVRSSPLSRASIPPGDLEVE